MDILSILIPIVSGAAGGNIAGAVLKKFNLGLIGNSIAGVVGGGLGSQLISMVSGGGIDGIIGDIAGGGVGGAVVLAIVGFVKSAMNKG